MKRLILFVLALIMLMSGNAICGPIERWNIGFYSNNNLCSGCDDYLQFSRKSYSQYTLYADFSSSTKDRVSGQHMTTTLEAGRPNYDGVVFADEQPVLDAAGLLTYGPYTNLVLWSEDLTNAAWITRGTVTIDSTNNLDPQGGYTATQISGIQEAASNDIYQLLAGAFTADALYSVSFNLRKITTTGIIAISSPYGVNFGRWYINLALLTTGWEVITAQHPAVTITDVFVASSSGGGGLLLKGANAGLFTVQLHGFQITETPYALPYIKTEATAVAVPQNYSDADEGYKWALSPDKIGSVYTGPAVGNDEWSTTLQHVVPSAFTDNGDFSYTASTPLVSVELITCNSNPDLPESRTYEFSYTASGSNGEHKAFIGGLGSLTPHIGDGTFVERGNIKGSRNLYLRGEIGFSGTLKVNSVKEVSRNMGMPDAFDSLDGKAEGTELLGAFSSMGSSWTDNGDGTYSCDGSVDTQLEFILPVMTVGTYCEIQLTITEYTSGTLRHASALGNFRTGFPFLTSAGTHRPRVSSTHDSQALRLFTTSFIGTVRVESIKLISPAQGEMVVEWTPMFDHDAGLIGHGNILSTQEAATNFLYVHFTTQDPSFYDGTTVAHPGSVNFQTGVTYLLHPIWGTHPTEGANKMQLIVDEKDGPGQWASAIVDFDGSFNPGPHLSAGWASIYPQSVKVIKIYKEPKSW